MRNMIPARNQFHGGISSSEESMSIKRLPVVINFLKYHLPQSTAVCQNAPDFHICKWCTVRVYSTCVGTYIFARHKQWTSKLYLFQFERQIPAIYVLTYFGIILSVYKSFLGLWNYLCSRNKYFACFSIYFLSSEITSSLRSSLPPRSTKCLHYQNMYTILSPYL